MALGKTAAASIGHLHHYEYYESTILAPVSRNAQQKHRSPGFCFFLLRFLLTFFSLLSYLILFLLFVHFKLCKIYANVKYLCAHAQRLGAMALDQKKNKKHHHHQKKITTKPEKPHNKYAIESIVSQMGGQQNKSALNL